MHEHKNGQTEIRFYNKNMKLMRQRFVDTLQFKTYLSKKIDEMQMQLEMDIFDGTCPILLGPKIILTGKGN